MEVEPWEKDFWVLKDMTFPGDSPTTFGEVRVIYEEEEFALFVARELIFQEYSWQDQPALLQRLLVGGTGLDFPSFTTAT